MTSLFFSRWESVIKKLPRRRVHAEGYDPDTGGFQWLVIGGERFSAKEVASWRLRIKRLKRQRDAVEKICRQVCAERDALLWRVTDLQRSEAEPHPSSGEAAAGSTPSPSPQGQPSSTSSGRKGFHHPA